MRDIKIFMMHRLQRLMFELSDGTTSLVVRPPIVRAETSEKISFFSDHPVLTYHSLFNAQSSAHWRQAVAGLETFRYRE